MRISKGKSRIRAVQLGEGELNLLIAGKPPLKGKFALINEEGAPCGFTENFLGWSDTTMKLLRQLSESMEKDIEESLFRGNGSDIEQEDPDTPEEDPEKKPEAVPQF